jgi:hypothetical protein
MLWRKGHGVRHYRADVLDKFETHDLETLAQVASETKILPRFRNTSVPWRFLDNKHLAEKVAWPMFELDAGDRWNLDAQRVPLIIGRQLR